MFEQTINNHSFWEGFSPEKLVKEYGSGLYVYNEALLRERCRELKNLVSYDNFVVDYSMKANSNPALLQIIHEEGLEVDVMSPGEIHMAEMAGYGPDEIFYICNNVAPDEMKYVIDKGIKVSVDSLGQLEQFGELAPHSKVSIRVNPGTGAGHHKKVVTAGKETKFGINTDCIEDIKRILKQYDLKLIGINQHIGSLFLNSTDYLKSADSLFSFALAFPDLDFVDLGGGFGIPYRAAEGETRLDLKELGLTLDTLFNDFSKKYGKKLLFRVEPGRYVVAECAKLLGTVNGVKYNEQNKYIGTDIGFNLLMRPVLYNSYHEIGFYRNEDFMDNKADGEIATIVGNICETGDILAKDRIFPLVRRGDTMIVHDAGAYGHVMSSNYNGRLKAAEVLLTADGTSKLIRKRDTFEDLVRNYIL